ncbi:MAG: hypothetical protein ACK5OC_04520 [Pirellula sp.]|jgi:hypothetical protein
MRPDKLLAERITSTVAATKWDECEVVGPMLRMLEGLVATVTPRKIRLFAMECCRRIDGFTQDVDCAKALALCEKMLAGEYVDAQVLAHREHIEFRRTRILRGLEPTTIGEWSLSAATHLLQTDREYFRNDGPRLSNVHEMCMSAGVRGQRIVRRWEDVRPGDFERVGAIYENQAAILSEILGNPFEAIDVEASWLTDEVVALATQHDKAPSCELMTQLHVALLQAGCKDQRILKHCSKPFPHLVGCWVIDTLLQRPTFADPVASWDYELTSDGLSDATLQQIKLLFKELAAHADGTPKPIALANVEWLHEQFAKLGLTAWVQFSRCTQELLRPSRRAAYIEAIASRYMWRICARYRISWPVFPSPTRLWEERWWDEEESASEFGLPTAVDTHRAGAPPIQSDLVAAALQQSFRNLPVRDVLFSGSFLQDGLKQFLCSPAGQTLTTIRSAIVATDHGLEPFTSLKDSGLTRTLRRLVIKSQIQGPHMQSLAETPFESLDELDLRGIECEASEFGELASRKWFRGLRSICGNFRGTAASTALPALSRLPELQSLAMPNAQEENFEHTDSLVFSALKRFYLRINNIKQPLKALQRYEAPELIEFWLDSPESIGKDLIQLFRCDLLRYINVLRLSTPKLTSQGVDALLQAPFAHELKILEVESHQLNGFSKKSKSLWSRSDSLPELISLDIQKLYSQPNFEDSADWLSKFACTKIRHLTLSECRLNEAGWEAILRNPIFKNLESLSICEGLRKCYVAPEYIERFVRALDFPNLRRLHLGSTPVGDRIEFLLDPAVLPNVDVAGFIDTHASAEMLKRINAVRPRFIVSD